MKRYKKYHYITVSSIILAFLCSGCSQTHKTDPVTSQDGTTEPTSTVTQSAETVDASNQTQQNENVAMGRYIEQNIPLPEMKATESGISMYLGSDSLPILYLFEEDSVTVTKYNLNSDDHWDKSTLDWTNSIKTGTLYQSKVLCDDQGTEYLFFVETNGNVYYPHLYKEEDGKAKEIEMEGWKEFDSSSTPENVDMLGDGTFTAIIDGDLCCYDTANGKLTASEDTKNNYVYATAANSIVRTINVNGSETTELDSYDNHALDADPEVFQYPAKNTYVFNLVKNSKGNYVIFGSEGILESNPDTHEFDTILPGEKTSLYLPNLYVNDIAATDEDVFYSLCSSDGYVLLRYQYDESIPTNAEYHLNLYSLYENPVLKTAIVKFQQIHPEYEFTYDYPLTYYDHYEDVDTKDYIQVFNTQLLAGDGPDLIDLSDLPAEDYIEKGALMDTTDIIQTYLDEGKLFQNVVEQFQTDGKYYAVPLQFNPICIFGPEDVINCNSLSDLIDFTTSHPDLDRNILGEVNLLCLTDTFIPSEYSTFVDADHTLSEENLKQFVKNLKQLYDITNGREREDDLPDQTHGNSYFGLSYNEYCYIGSIAGFDDMIMPLSANALTNGDFDSYGQAFIPENRFGINTDSKNVDGIKEFYRFLFSDEFMSELNNTGFPVNKAAFAALKSVDRKFHEDAGFNVRISENESKRIPLTPLTQEQKDRLEQICLNVNKVCTTDTTVNDILYDGILGYITDTEDVDAAMNEVLSKMKIYVAE